MAGSSSPIVEVLAHSPRFIAGVALFELFTPRNRAISRQLKLVRLRVSFRVACPWCVEMNSTDLARAKITDEELAFLQGRGPRPNSFSDRDTSVVALADAVSAAPVQLPPDLKTDLQNLFSHKEILSLTWAASQVNFFARLFQSWT